MPAVGQLAPSFSAATLSGEPVTLDSLRGQRGVLLVFARTSCPFTVEALPAVAKIAGDYRKNGVAVTVINSGEQKDHIRPIYDKHAPGVGVVWDESGQISNAYGVDMTPFFFLLDKDGKIAQRRSFTPAAASACLDSFLGLPAQAPRYKPTEAG
jgi:peroxiredoxin